MTSNILRGDKNLSPRVHATIKQQKNQLYWSIYLSQYNNGYDTGEWKSKHPLIRFPADRIISHQPLTFKEMQIQPFSV